MNILVSDINADCKTLDEKFLCFFNKYEIIDNVKTKVYAVEIETGLRILNPDFVVNVKETFCY